MLINTAYLPVNVSHSPNRLLPPLGRGPHFVNHDAQRGPETPGQTDVWGWPASRPPVGQKSSSSGGGACSHGVRGCMSARPRANRGPRHHTLPRRLSLVSALRLGRGPGLQPLSSVWLWRFHSM
eukprot:7386158-Prymnesium_polylepis.2